MNMLKFTPFIFLFFSHLSFSMDYPGMPMPMPHAGDFQYDAMASQEFWKRVNELDSQSEIADLRTFYENNSQSINLNVQKEISDAPDTAIASTLDCAYFANNAAAFSWLNGLNAAPLTFAYETIGGQRKFGVAPKLNGKAGVQFWLSAKNNDLRDMNLHTQVNGDFPVDVMRDGLTPLDFAVKHKNEDMARYLLNMKAKLGVYTPDDFKNAFPKLWPLTPPGKAEAEKEVATLKVFEESRMLDIRKNEEIVRLMHQNSLYEQELSRLNSELLSQSSLAASKIADYEKLISDLNNPFLNSSHIAAQAPAPAAPVQVIVPVLQFSYELSNQFWMHALKGQFYEMKALYNSNSDAISLNVQQQFRESYVMTVLDWAMVQNNREMILWLLDKGAWSFRYTIADFKERFPDLEQKYNGRKTYHYWHAAEKNKLQDMIEMLDTSARAISVNLIRAKKTPLDFAVEYKNEAMAKHLLDQGGRLCFVTPEEFSKAFPNLVGLPLPVKDKVEVAKNAPEMAPVSFVGSLEKSQLEDEINALKALSQSQVKQITQLESKTLCSVCLEKDKSIALPCGHMYCNECPAQLKDCAICRAPYRHKVDKLFQVFH